MGFKSYLLHSLNHPCLTEMRICHLAVADLATILCLYPYNMMGGKWYPVFLSNLMFRAQVFSNFILGSWETCNAQQGCYKCYWAIISGGLYSEIKTVWGEEEKNLSQKYAEAWGEISTFFCCCLTEQDSHQYILNMIQYQNKSCCRCLTYKHSFL